LFSNFVEEKIENIKSKIWHLGLIEIQGVFLYVWICNTISSSPLSFFILP
jgi:hypothetical protein